VNAILLGGTFLWAFGVTPLLAQTGASPPEHEIVVRGLPVSNVETEPEVASTVIGEVDLRRPGETVASVLSRTPGVQINQTGSSAELSTVSIRGAGAAQVPVYLAGVRLNDDIVGVADLSRVPLWMLHRVEVVRSAVPVHLSRGGLTGAVVFEPNFPWQSELRVGTMAGSFGTGAVWFGGTQAYGNSESGGPFGATSVSIKRRGAENNFTFVDNGGTAFDDTDDAETERGNADFSDTDIWVVSQARIPMLDRAVSLQAFFGHLSREQGATGLSLSPAEEARERTRQGLFGLTSSIPCTVGSSSCRFQSTTGASTTGLQTTDPLNELSLGSPLLEQKNDRVAQTFQFAVRPGEEWEASLGASYEASRLTRDAPDGAWVRARESFVGATGALEYSPSPLVVRVVARGSCSSDDGVETGGTPLAVELRQGNRCGPEGRLGVHYSLTEALSVRATLIRGLRFATLGELYGVSSTTRGNPGLHLEKSWGTDVGARFSSLLESWGTAWVDATAYLRFDEDLVAYRRSALGYVRPYNVGHSRFLGGELGGEIDAWSHFRARSSLSLMDPRDISEGSESAPLVPYRSPVTMTQELEVYSLQASPSVSRLAFGARLNYRSSRTADPAGLITIPQDLTLDLNVGLELKQSVLFQGRIENVFNAERFDFLGLPLPGRGVFVSAEMRL
jgi:vitamin B12 transporter